MAVGRNCVSPNTPRFTHSALVLRFHSLEIPVRACPDLSDDSAKSKGKRNLIVNVLLDENCRVEDDLGAPSSIKHFEHWFTHPQETTK
jgi:hypothetical protein